MRYACTPCFVLILILPDATDCDDATEVNTYIHSAARLLSRGTMPDRRPTVALKCVMFHHQLNLCVIGWRPAMRVSIERTYFHRETMLMLILLAATREEVKRRGCGSKRWVQERFEEDGSGQGRPEGCAAWRGHAGVSHQHYNGQRRLQNANVRGMMRCCVVSTCGWLATCRWTRWRCFAST